ncbi:MAG TPA: hypothetical protein PK218_05830 [Flavobacterium sp.]|uniref:hypothetical protein n=1 Tax=Flavobacterium sp. TaxID=239 RepID=UPI002C483F7E|nr:hypothetical protein [Flavobacterium sp.]MCA0349464.1 hypothetical protein [Bacteroidota bacterium]HPW98060.1 hypothetical protein [Flavobacterium sp.]HQA74278.1 hypothetical protein [Flavobacterium sp.]
MKKILPFFSYILHPVFIPLFGTLFYIILDENYFTFPQVLVLLLQIIIISILLPIAFFFLLRTFGKIDNIMLSDLSQRKIPLLLQIMLFSVLVTKSITLERFPELHYFFMGGIISSIVAFVLLYIKIKASIHLIGTSALTIFVLGLSYHNQVNIINTIIFIMILNGFVASSRLEMKAHNTKELVFGFFVGALPQIGLLFFWL